MGQGVKRGGGGCIGNEQLRCGRGKSSRSDAAMPLVSMRERPSIFYTGCLESINTLDRLVVIQKCHTAQQASVVPG